MPLGKNVSRTPLLRTNSRYAPTTAPLMLSSTVNARPRPAPGSRSTSGPGTVRTNPGSYAAASARQPPGHGWRTDSGLVRYLLSGVRDTTFGSGGFAALRDLGIGSTRPGLAVQSGDKLVWAGATASNGTSPAFAVVRFNANGERHHGKGVRDASRRSAAEASGAGSHSGRRR